MKPPFRPARRLLPAAAVALAVALVGGAVLGVAAASGDEEAVPTVHVPPARIGDRATYDVTLTGDWLYQDKPEGKPFPFLSFAWNGNGSIRDADGRMHPTETVQATGLAYVPYNIEFVFDSEKGMEMRQGPAWLPDNQTAWFEPGQNQLVALGTEEAKAEGYDMLPLPVLRQQVDAQVTVNSFATGEESLCLVAPGVASDLPVEGRVPLRPCSIPSLGFATAGTPFAARGLETVNGVSALHLDDGQTHVWFAPGIPFPVRFEATMATILSHDMDMGEGTFRLDLVGYDPGSEARGPRGPLGPEPDPLPTAPRAAWGMDEAGVQIPFPASLAFQKAKEGDKDFAALLERSPDAYLSSAWHIGSHPSGTAEERSEWLLELTDGKDAVALTVTQTVRTLRPLGGPALPTDAATRYEVRPMPSYGEAAGLPPPSALPEEWPTVAGLLERWSLYSGTPAAQGNAWGHRVHCADEGCAKAEFLLEAGRMQVDSAPARVQPDPADPVLVAPFDFAWSSLATDIHGTAYFFADTQMTSGTTPAVGAASSPPQASAQEQGVAAPPSLVRMGVLAGPEGAGVGLLALVSGLLYWAWPALKSGGAIGLFSRLRASRLLNHPQRARLHDLVTAEPGIHFQELARRSGLPNGTLVHHLQALAGAGLVVAHRAGGYTCYFPRAASGAQRSAAGATRSDGARAVLAAIQSNPGAAMTDIAAACGLQASTVTYHVQRLAQAGLVDVSRDGRFQRLRARAAA